VLYPVGATMIFSGEGGAVRKFAYRLPFKSLNTLKTELHIKLNSYLTGSTLGLHHTDQPVNAVYCENHTNTQIHCVGRIQCFSILKQVVHTVTTEL
jgi:hypothetical protein